MPSVLKFRLIITLVLAALAFLSPASAANQNFFPLQDVRPGLRGTGKTVFQGNRIEEFQVEILGVIENLAPKQPIILARLSGGPLAETGILQGMSGSPVYIGGKLLGAVALGFPFSKEPICGIQPIQAMLSGATLQALSLQRNSLLQNISSSSIRPNSQSSPLGDLTDILTPLSTTGFTPNTLVALHPVWQRFGLAAQGLGSTNLVPISAKNSLSVSINSSQINDLPQLPLQPGSMISVGLVTGDWNMTADGTVTYVDGNRIYAFGHRFLGIGPTEIPLAISDVLASVPSTQTSFKISAPRQWIGAITSDHATAIAGELGRTAHTIPIEIAVSSAATGAHTYHLQVVNDRLLTPFLTQAALFSTLDATERTVGVSTLKLQGEIHFEGGLPSLMIHDEFVSETALAQQASADAVAGLTFVLGGGFQNLHVKDITFHVDELDRKKQLHLSQAWASAHEVHAGDSIDITAILQSENGAEVVKTIPYHVPTGAPLGALNLTLSDANTLNFSEYAGISQTQFKTATSMIDAINRYRSSDSLFIRIWRQQPGFNVAGALPGGELSDPPPSVALILADPSSSASGGVTANTRGSDVDQLSIPVDGYAIIGAKTIQIEIKD